MGHARRGVCKGKVSVDSGGEFGMQILWWGLLVVCKDDFTGEGGEVRKGHRYKEVSRERERGRGSPGIHCVLLIHIAIWIIDRRGGDCREVEGEDHLSKAEERV